MKKLIVGILVGFLLGSVIVISSIYIYKKSYQDAFDRGLKYEYRQLEHRGCGSFVNGEWVWK